MSDDIPDSPVRRVTVEHADGTVRELEGEQAETWVQRVARGLAYMEARDGRTLEVDWSEYDSDE